MTGVVDEDISNGIQTLVLNRPGKKNAITVEMYQMLADALQRAELSEDVTVTVITGEGGDFSSGNDVKDFIDISSTPERMAPIMLFLHTLMAYKKPLLGAVEGWSVGVGATMLLHCDMIFCARNARFVFPFVNLGLVPEAASSFLLPQLMGHQRAFEILMFGEPVLADEAYRLGMVNQLCEPEEALLVAKNYAQRLTELPHEAVCLSKDLMKCRTVDDVQMALMREGRMFKDRLLSPEAISQFAKFLNK